MIEGRLIILTGASGSGKTAITRAIAVRHREIPCLFFDSIGVPSQEEMERLYGSGENWQKEKTKEWVKRICNKHLGRIAVLFEGQMRLAFIREAINHSGVINAIIVLVDCDDDTRARRLRDERMQPELANPTMMNWAAFLRREAEETNATILDTSQQSLEESVAFVSALLRSPGHEDKS